MKIIITGPATAQDMTTGAELTDEARLRALDGLAHQDQLCCETLFDPLVNDLSISGGAIRLAYDPGRGGLKVISEYWSPVALTPDQLQVLIDHTLAQWSDGIGEGCFQEWSDQHGIALDLAPFADPSYTDPVAEQVADGRAAPRYAHLPKAVWGGAAEVVEQAIAERADLNAIYDGHTALLLALMKQQTGIALRLIEGGADVHRATPMGTTPLMACANLEQPTEALAVATALLTRGAEIDARDLSGNTALDEARNLGRKELADFLANH